MNININKQSGFTLIELLIVLGIVGTLAVLAVPSYRSYMVNNRQQQAKADMLKIEGQLEQWRAKSLSYTGFIPKSGYVDTTQSMFESPASSSDKKYEIWVHSYIKNASSVTVAQIKGASISPNWLIRAVPINANAGLNSYLMTSNGIRCSTPKKADLAETALSDLITNRNCGIQSGDW